MTTFLKVLDASTAHVKPSSPEWLWSLAAEPDHGDAQRFPVLMSNIYGLLLSVPEDEVALSEADRNNDDPWPGDVVALLRHAMSLGADYVLVDADGGALEGLATYDD